MCHNSWQCFLSWHWTNCPCKPKCLDSSRLLCGLLNTNVAFPPAITLPVSVAQLSQWGKSCQVLQALVFGVWQRMCLCPSVPRPFFFFFFSSLGMLSLPVTEAQRVLSFVLFRQDQIFLSALRVHFLFPRSLYIHTVGVQLSRAVLLLLLLLLLLLHSPP